MSQRLFWPESTRVTEAKGHSRNVLPSLFVRFPTHDGNPKQCIDMEYFCLEDNGFLVNTPHVQRYKCDENELHSETHARS